MPRIEKSSETPPLVSELTTPGTFLSASNAVCGRSFSSSCLDTTLLLTSAASCPTASSLSSGGSCWPWGPLLTGGDPAGGVVELPSAWADERGSNAHAAPIRNLRAVTLLEIARGTPWYTYARANLTHDESRVNPFSG